MPRSTISVHGVSKRFNRRDGADSLRDLVAGIFRRGGRLGRAAESEFFALQDVSFDVEPGEAFGIIGPNGAGKSTMLKLLAGILRPTRGRMDILGRVSALIELGAGFHGDLTGRENIYLNASILGMSRAEVRRKFDEIVAFAGIDGFLDTPLKRYSSGMHARLGFAIAAHAEPQILLVDEVLSVGDRVFRAKCLDKMSQFRRDGVAVVFVSHDLGTVNRFCNRTMVLDHGRVMYCGPSSEAIGLYYDACSQSLVARTEDGSPQVRITHIEIRDMAGRPIATARSGDRIRFSFEAEFVSEMARPSFGLSLIRSSDHITMYESSSTRLGHETAPAHAGTRRRITYELDLNVGPGQYALGLHVRDRDAMQYAVEMAYADHILVDSDAPNAGLVHVNPVFGVEELRCGGREAVLV